MRYRLSRGAAAAIYRASGLVHWPLALRFYRGVTGLLGGAEARESGSWLRQRFAVREQG